MHDCKKLEERITEIESKLESLADLDTVEDFLTCFSVLFCKQELRTASGKLVNPGGM